MKPTYKKKLFGGLHKIQAQEKYFVQYQEELGRQVAKGHKV